MGGGRAFRFPSLRAVELLCITVLIAACSTSGPQRQPEVSPQPTVTTKSSPPGTAPQDGSCEPSQETEHVLVELQSPDTNVWDSYLTVDYGDAENEVGLSHGGDDGGLEWGPDGAAIGADGAVWVVDTANARVVVLTPQGSIREVFELPHQFGGQFPVLLDDGTFVLSSGLRGLLVKRRGVDPVVIPTDYPSFWRYARGTTLFGTRLVDRTEESVRTHLEVNADGYLLAESGPYPEPVPDVEWIVDLYGEGSAPSTAGSFTVRTACDTKIFQLDLADPTVLPSVEYAVDNEGALHALLYATVGSDENFVTVGSYARFDPTGPVCVTAIPPFGPGVPPNPGSPNRLQVEGTTGQVYGVDVSNAGLQVWAAARSCASSTSELENADG